MFKKLSIYDLGFFILLLLILAYPTECIAACKSGLLLWFNVIIPTLFPFILISYIIINSPIIDIISKYFSPIINFLFGASGYAGYAFIMGSISGYPMGGKIVSDLLSKNKITNKEAQYILTFCNNPSPMFIIGFIACELLHEPNLAIPMLVSIHIGNLITAFIYKKIYSIRTFTKNNYKASSREKLSFSYFDRCLTNTADILVKIGCYIIFFSLPVTLLLKLPINNILYYFTLSNIELSNGCHLLSSININLNLKFTLISSLSAFGSFSVIGQTASVINDNSLSIKKYFFSKIINGLVTLVIAFIVINIYMLKIW
jgi:sporulation integral membrane protein YlbJ